MAVNANVVTVMSQDKVTPITRTKGTPKRMRPLISRVSYYLVAILGLLQIIAGGYVSYENGIGGIYAPIFALQPPLLVAVIEIFSGIFALVAAFGLRRLAYWGTLSIAVFGVFEFLNSNLLTEVIQFGLTTTTGTTTLGSLPAGLILTFQVVGVLIVILSGFSYIGIRQHRKVAGELKA